MVKDNMKLHTYILFFICLLANLTINAQGVDSLFKVAREYAFNGEKVKARSICDDILRRSPNYNEVRILKGRTYSWDGMRDSARIEFYQVLANDSTETEAWLALSDLEFWDDKPQASLFAAENGLKYAPDNKEFILKKIRANIELKNYEQAEKDLNQLKEKDTTCAACIDYEEKLYRLQAVHHVSAGISFDYFDGAYTSNPFFHYQFIQYGYRSPQNTIIGRVNFNQRFGTSGVQPEFDWYRKLPWRSYLYVNYGYTPYELFPRHRLGIEWYKNFPRSFEASLGFRFLNFGVNSDVWIYTASLTKYIGNYAIIGRTFITPDPAAKSFSRSVIFNLRRYTLDEDNFIGLVAGAGYSPDQRLWQADNSEERTQLYFMQAYRIGGIYSFTVRFKHLWILEFDYRYQEIPANKDNFTPTYGAGISYRYRF